MKALGITQVHPGLLFSSNVGVTECDVVVWRYNANLTDSSLIQEKLTKKYNSEGAPYLISFANGDLVLQHCSSTCIAEFLFYFSAANPISRGKCVMSCDRNLQYQGKKRLD